jgi:transcriptional regulator with XRE-family HTH domain
MSAGHVTSSLQGGGGNLGKPLPSFGRRLRRLRRLRGWKQSQIAELASVCQTTVSRWEAGVIAPAHDSADALLAALTSFTAVDEALRRLVESSNVPAHLIGEADHRLMAASPAREREWRRSAAELSGASLWPFATDEIVAAEAQLEALRWWEEQAPAAVTVRTGERNDKDLIIVAGTMIWERIYLADGTPARLCSSAPA